MTDRPLEPGERVAAGAPLRVRELAERIRKNGERLQQVRATAKTLIREVEAGPPSS
ncbi:hypothetical protein [Streptosporangium canum]|uniref:hypothetical protein n=1 Tax=Streptosporangium canum TaxID=324952 RepID=UPI0037BA1F22